MSNDSTNKVDPVIKCFFVSFCTIMAMVFILSFSIKVLILCFVIYGLTIIPLNTLFMSSVVSDYSDGHYIVCGM